MNENKKVAQKEQLEILNNKIIFTNDNFKLIKTDISKNGLIIDITF